jgi:hypothetical protein
VERRGDSRRLVRLAEPGQAHCTPSPSALGGDEAEHGGKLGLDPANLADGGQDRLVLHHDQPAPAEAASARYGS